MLSHNWQNLQVIITPDVQSAANIEQELKFFIADTTTQILNFPDCETLPYDHFSPHQDIVSERLWTLYQAPKLKSGIIIIAATTLMQRLPPCEYIEAHSFILKVNDKLDITELRKRLEKYGYNCVTKVMEHGEFAVRGSIIDLFPMGSKEPLRIDLFDDQVESIRTFDPDSQRSINKISDIQLLPAKECPLDEDSIRLFRQAWRMHFSGDPTKCPIYESISAHENHPGIEAYLPLFFAKVATVFDYLPQNSVIIKIGDIEKVATDYWQSIKYRYEQLRHDKLHPLLSPKDIFTPVDELFAGINRFSVTHCFETQKVNVDLNGLQDCIANSPNARFLFIAESTGRREHLLELLQTKNIQPTAFNGWNDFLKSNDRFGVTVAALERSMHLFLDSEIILLTETQLFGQQVMQRRLRDKSQRQDPENIIRDLTELKIGAPVVHIDHGVGRYLGLQTLKTDSQETEFLVLEYANQAKLYIPVASLNLISRYTGVDAEHAPITTLGTNQWEKSKRAAYEKIRDVAAEMLEIYAARQAAKGFIFTLPENDYQRFASAFPFEETPDQERAIADVINDMTSPRPMDRLICGDVGFGKTEVAMRAAFIAAHGGKQVAVLAPTTLLTQQHFENFRDRFSDWPIKIEMISRFRSAKDQQNVLENLSTGKIDIIIGTHKLLQSSVQFKNLGLLIIDEEHRFGVKQKDFIKKIRPNIDVLALTATPIPRTLNMAFANIRDFSIIATPPAKRLAVKTFAHERDNHLIREALSREILRGGQVYFLHNDIATISKTAHELEELLPQARITIAHGQMHERQLENIMSDFYHLRTNVLVCTTIIESGIDIPTANTIIIDRADRFGLAQLHQLRGRVGRSHHQAYAYLLIPPVKLLTPDARKRLDAFVAMGDLGIGFSLATHDLEIRGAGELLGEEQSGEMQEIGFNLYMEILERAVHALKQGKEINFDEPIKPSIEIDLQIPVLIPEKYLDDVNARLVLYKRIANAKNKNELDELQVEMIDRFGLLPEPTKNLFAIAELRLDAEKLGIRKIIYGKNKGNIEFIAKPNIDSLKIIKLIQLQPKIYKLRGQNKLEFTTEILAPKQKIEFVTALISRFY